MTTAAWYNAVAVSLDLLVIFLIWEKRTIVTATLGGCLKRLPCCYTDFCSIYFFSLVGYFGSV